MLNLFYAKVRNLFQKQLHKDKENGRSMIEMLTVLAVAGMLSVVMLIGYQRMITKNKVNNLINELRLCSSIVTAAHLSNPNAKPDISECLGGILDKYDIEVSEPYTYEGEAKEYYEFTLHHVPDDMVDALMDAYSSFSTGMKVNGKDVVNGKVVSFNKSLLISSAYAETGNDITFEVPVDDDPKTGTEEENNCGKCYDKSEIDGTCFFNYFKCPTACIDKNGNPITGMVCLDEDKWYVECVNGKEKGGTSSCPYRNGVGTYCDMKSNECKCKIDCSIDGHDTGRTINQENCQCECPTGKYWDGSQCTEKECDDVSDCIGWFSDLDAECLSCENKKCTSKINICEGNYTWHCLNGKKTKTGPYCNPDRNLECVDGECECVDDDLCEIGVTECTGSNTYAMCLDSHSASGSCPYWRSYTCDEGGECDDKTGQCKYHECTPGDEKCNDTNLANTGTSDKCAQNGKWIPYGGDGKCCHGSLGPRCGKICCAFGQICSNGHCCDSGETWASKDSKCCSNVSAGHCCGSDEAWVED